MAKKITFVRWAVMRTAKGDKRVEVSSLGPIRVPVLDGWADYGMGLSRPVFGAIEYQHAPGDMTVSGLPIYR
jgi:hypothetical protein